MLSEKKVFGLVIGLVIAIGADVQASFVENMRLALGAAGFQQQLTRDPLSDGWNLQFGQTFNNRTFDFGNAELTLLSGNMQGRASIGNRGIPELELELNSTQIPYTFESFDGVHKLHVDDGVFQITSDIKVNKFGSYDVQLNVINRGTLISDDPAAGSVSIDYDLGKWR
jgi:hypothetical protein